MTQREQIYIEDLYNNLHEDLEMVRQQLEDPHEEGWDFGEFDRLSEEYTDIWEKIFLIDSFIRFAGYTWKEINPNYYTLVKKD